MYSIETHKLTHRYSRKESVLHEVGLRVREGSIYGFLGPNGAGKTTTLRLILGLLKKQDGEIRVFGRHLEGNRLEILRRVGSLIESPSIYSHLTATENLRILQSVYRCSPERVRDVLSLTGLQSTGKKRAGDFSLGMKQRLGIAMALLSRPRLLILDEPTNGLDPEGILEIRDLLRTLKRDHGVTILLSSHLLGEIEKLVDDVGIIHRGRILFQGTLAELQNRRNASFVVSFRTSDQTRAAKVIAAHGKDIISDGENISTAGLNDDSIAEINRALILNGLSVYSIERKADDLERIFLDFVSR